MNKKRKKQTRKRRYVVYVVVLRFIKCIIFSKFII